MGQHEFHDPSQVRSEKVEKTVSVLVANNVLGMLTFEFMVFWVSIHQIELQSLESNAEACWWAISMYIYSVIYIER